MIRFGIVLSVVLLAIGLLVTGVVAGSLLLVAISIGVALIALLLLVGVVISFRHEIFGSAAANAQQGGVSGEVPPVVLMSRLKAPAESKAVPRVTALDAPGQPEGTDGQRAAAGNAEAAPAAAAADGESEQPPAEAPTVTPAPSKAADDIIAGAEQASGEDGSSGPDEYSGSHGSSAPDRRSDKGPRERDPSAAVQPPDSKPAEAADGTAAPEPVGAQPEPGEAAQVSVVPGITRYHRSDCLLIRFLSADDLEVMTRREATDNGCVPCKACKPDQEAANLAVG